MHSPRQFHEYFLNAREGDKPDINTNIKIRKRKQKFIYVIVKVHIMWTIIPYKHLKIIFIADCENCPFVVKHMYGIIFHSYIKLKRQKVLNTVLHKCGYNTILVDTCTSANNEIRIKNMYRWAIKKTFAVE